MLLYGGMCGMGGAKTRRHSWVRPGIKASLLLLPAAGGLAARVAWGRGGGCSVIRLRFCLSVPGRFVRFHGASGSEHWMLRRRQVSPGSPTYIPLLRVTSASRCADLPGLGTCRWRPMQPGRWEHQAERFPVDRPLLSRGTLMARHRRSGSAPRRMLASAGAVPESYQAALRWKGPGPATFVRGTFLWLRPRSSACSASTVPGSKRQGDRGLAPRALQGTQRPLRRQQRRAQARLWDAVRQCSEAQYCAPGHRRVSDIKNELLAVYAEEGYGYPLEQSLERAFPVPAVRLAGLGPAGAAAALLMLVAGA